MSKKRILPYNKNYKTENVRRIPPKKKQNSLAVNITHIFLEPKKPNLSSIPKKQVTEKYKYLTSKRLVRSYNIARENI